MLPRCGCLFPCSGCLFPPQVRKLLSYYFFKNVFCPFFFLDPYKVNVSALNIVPELSTYPQFFSVILGDSITLSSRLLIHSSTSTYSVDIFYCIFSFLVIVTFSSDWLYFLFVKILTVFIQLLLSSVNILISNFLQGRLLISISFSSFSGILSYSFVWNISLCILNLPNFPCLFLCTGQVHYVFWSWRSGLMGYPTRSRIHQHAPLRPSELDIPEVPPEWAAHALLLWQSQ